MRKNGGLKLLILGIMLAMPVSLFATNSKLSAASCSNISSFGAINLNVPTLPNDGAVNIWVRMQSPEASTSLLLEVNKSTCLELNAKDLSSDRWTWRSVTESDNSELFEFPGASDNTLKIIGTSDGVKIDKVLFTAKNCIPQEFGDNCIDAVEAVGVSNDNATQIPSPSEGAVSGKVYLTSTPDNYSSNLEQVDYVVNGKTIQKSFSAEPFDTTRLENGKHTILIETKLNDGRVIRESTILQVKNSINPLSPVIRWIKINSETAKLFAITLLAAVILIISFLVIRTVLKKRRERKFHGF
jgi:hypothetical protein